MGRLHHLPGKLMVIGIVLLFYFVGLLPVVHAADSAEMKPLRVYLVQWRGTTGADKGFIDYLKKTRLPIEFTVLNSGRDKSKLLEIRERIRSERPDLVYTFGTTVTKTLAGTVSSRDPQTFITDIPIVFAVVAAPVKAGILSEVGNSKSNVTGVSHLPSLDMQLAAIKDFLHIERMGIIYNPTEDNSTAQVETLVGLSDEYGFKVIKGPLPLDGAGVPKKDSIGEVLAHLKNEQVDLIYLPSDSFLLANIPALKRALTLQGVLSYASVEAFAREGGALFGLVSNYYNVGSFCGYKAQQILEKRMSPDEIPVETLKKFTVLINMDTARKTKVYPPIDLLSFAEVLDEGIH